MARKKPHYLYGRFRWIIATTTNPQHADWKCCGAKGIKSYWNTNQFSDFVEYIEKKLGPPQYPNIYLSRINQVGDFAPGNLTWSSGKSLGRRHLVNVFVTYRRQKKTVKEWSEIYNINYHTLRGRLARGWTFSAAISKPIGNNYVSRKTV